MGRKAPTQSLMFGSTFRYYFITWQGSLEVNPSVLIGSFLVGISPYGPVSKAGKFETSMARVPYNKLFTNLASSSRTGEYWPLVIFVRTHNLGPIFSSTALALG